MADDKSFNDRLVSKTVLPVIYLWMLASGAVVFMGIQDPDTVLANLDGFIALIAIIGGVAAPALSTLLRMWEAEQTNEVAEIPADYEHARSEGTRQHTHRMIVEKHSVGIQVPGALEEE
tara:strand:- start:216 stop:572 length:357 start_codon:yes stop_codon:yes gene_type:complete